LSIAVIHGEEKVSELDRDDGRNSPPPHDIEKSGVTAGLHILPGE